MTAATDDDTAHAAMLIRVDRADARYRAAKGRDAPPPRWPSSRAALIELMRHRFDGVESKSTSAPIAKLATIEAFAEDRKKRATATIPREERTHYDQASAVHLSEVARALEAAFLGPWRVSETPRVELDAATCRAILIARICGEPVDDLLARKKHDAPGEKRGDAKAWLHSTVRAWRARDEEAVAEQATKRSGAEVTVGTVRAIVKHGLFRVTIALSGRGLVPLPKGAASMGMVQDAWDVEGWKDIAKAIGVPERTARRWADRDVLPLPVSRFAGRIVAKADALKQWVREEFERGLG